MSTRADGADGAAGLAVRLGGAVRCERAPFLRKVRTEFGRGGASPARGADGAGEASSAARRSSSIWSKDLWGAPLTGTSSRSWGEGERAGSRAGSGSPGGSGWAGAGSAPGGKAKASSSKASGTAAGARGAFSAASSSRGRSTRASAGAAASESRGAAPTGRSARASTFSQVTLTRIASPSPNERRASASSPRFAARGILFRFLADAWPVEAYSSGGIGPPGCNSCSDDLRKGGGWKMMR